MIESKKRGIIIAIFGATGCGKTRYKDILKELGWREIKSTATRQPRSSRDIEYNFVSPEHFSASERAGKLINVNKYLGQMYGTWRESFDSATKSVMLTDITNVNDTRAQDDLKNIAKKANKELILIYCTSPKEGEIIRRHNSRGTPERIDIALKEIEKMDATVARTVPTAIWAHDIDDVLFLSQSAEKNEAVF